MLGIPAFYKNIGMRMKGISESSLREGFFSRRSNLTTIATSVRIKAPACAGSDSYRMTTDFKTNLISQKKRPAIRFAGRFF
jgi:hypothetical protein